MSLSFLKVVMVLPSVLWHRFFLAAAYYCFVLFCRVFLLHEVLIPGNDGSLFWGDQVWDMIGWIVGKTT